MPRARESSPFRRMLQFAAYDGVVVGGIAVALMGGTYALLGFLPDGPLLGVAFCGTVLVYQLDRVLDLSPEDRFNQPRRRAWMRVHRRYVWATIGGAVVGGGILLPFLHGSTLLAGLGLGTLGLGYVLPVLPGGRRLKSVGPIKVVAIAGAWAIGAVLLPVLEAGHSLTAGVGALAGYRFLFLLPNALLADAADRVGDIRAGLQTVTRRWTLRVIRWIATGALALTLGVGVLAWMHFGAPALLLADLIGPVLMLGAVWRAHRWPPMVRRAVPDLIVAWPAVTAAVGWVTSH